MTIAITFSFRLDVSSLWLCIAIGVLLPNSKDRRHVACRRHAMPLFAKGVRGHASPENFEF